MGLIIYILEKVIHINEEIFGENVLLLKIISLYLHLLCESDVYYFFVHGWQHLEKMFSSVILFVNLM